MELPRIIVGTSSLGSVRPDALVSSSERERAFEYLDRLVEIGCTAFDLAASYQVGGTERLFGRWMESRRNRDRLFLIGKGGHPFPIVAPHRLTPNALTSDLDDSLRRLRTDVIDLYLLHRDDETAALDPVIEALRRFQSQGKIRGWGVSNFTHNRIRRMNDLARVAKLDSISASSPHFSLFEWAKPPFPGCISIAGSRSALDYYAQTKLPILAWSSLGSGFAAGKSTPAYSTEANRERLRRCQDLAKKRDVDASQIALAYLFHQKFPVHAIVATHSPERMRKNLEAQSIELTEEDVRWLASG